MEVSIIDRKLALERAGGDQALADELFAMLLGELPTHSAALKAALNGRDLVTLREQAHRLKGATTYCGVPALHSAAAELHDHLRRGETAELDGDVAVVLDEITQVLEHAHR